MTQGQHILVEDACNEDAKFRWPIKNDVTAVFEPT
jgi:hypothetical protein